MNKIQKGVAALPPAVDSAAGIQEGTPAFALNEAVVAFAGYEWYVIGDGTSTTFTITNGKDGVGVASAAWSENGELVFTFTDGTQINLGPLPGAAIPASATASGDKGKSDTAVPVAAGAASGAVASGLLYQLLPLLRKKIKP